MTLKNPKTILFGSLIVAMLLPFSAMNYAEAVTVSDQIDGLIDKYNNLEKERQFLISTLEKAKPTDKEGIEKVRTHIDIVKSKMDKVLNKIENLSEQEVKPESNGIITPKVITVGSVIVAEITETECDDWNDSTTSGATGVISGDQITWSFVMAPTKSVGWSSWTGCTTMYFDESKVMVRNITQKERCNDVVTIYSSNTVTGECVCGLESGDLLAWQMNIDYQNVYNPSDTSGNKVLYGVHRVS